LPGKGMAQADRQPGLADPALAGGDGEDPAHARRPPAAAASAGGVPAPRAPASS
jgi:hypothetical protein